MADNETHFCATPAPAGRDVPPGQVFSSKGAILAGSKWQPGDSISIRFLAGSEALQQRVTDVAREWEDYANLSFEFVTSGQALIRIDFQPGKGSWSYIGTDCQEIPAGEPTMNYGWLTEESPDDEVRRVVLHEFGHAIGFIHEHQNPNGGIRWNKEAVINDLAGPPNNWDEATIENNMFRKYEDVIATPVDSTSIMMYPIPASWTEDGYFSADLNSTLSPTDKQLAGDVYPR